MYSINALSTTWKYDNMRAIWKVTSSELLTKEAMRKKILHAKDM
jgi:hypothetical protein